MLTTVEIVFSDRTLKFNLFRGDDLYEAVTKFSINENVMSHRDEIYQLLENEITEFKRQ